MRLLKNLLLRIDRAQRHKISSYRWVFYGEDRLTETMARQDRKALKNLRLGALGLILLIAALACSSAMDPFLVQIERPSFGEGLKTEELVVLAEDGKEKTSMPIALDIAEEELTAEGAADLFAAAQKEIQSVMLGENLSFETICSDLTLPMSAARGLVQVFWVSSDPQFVSEDGRVFLSGCSDGTEVRLQGTLWAANHSFEMEVPLILMPSGASQKDLLVSAANKAVSILAASKNGPVDLPPDQDGVTLHWKKQTSVSFGAIFAMGLLILSFIWFGRYDSLRDRLKKEAALADAQLSDVMLRLILLLDAGLVSGAAFSQLAEESKKDEGPITRALWTISRQCEEENTSFPWAFYAFAVSSANRELIRFAALIKENASHGSELAEKLRKESTRLRESRLSAARAKAREAETRLCFPLILLLFSLLAIAAGPVFLEM